MTPPDEARDALARKAMAGTLHSLHLPDSWHWFDEAEWDRVGTSKRGSSPEFADAILSRLAASGWVVQRAWPTRDELRRMSPGEVNRFLASRGATIRVADPDAIPAPALPAPLALDAIRAAVEGLPGWVIEATRAYGLAPVTPRDIALLEGSRIEVPPAVITVTNANRDSGLVDRAAVLAILRAAIRAEAPAPSRETLLALLGRSHPHDEGRDCGTCEAYRLIAALPAPAPSMPPAVGLDVDVLAEALMVIPTPNTHEEWLRQRDRSYLMDAKDIAAEYTRLAPAPAPVGDGLRDAAQALVDEWDAAMAGDMPLNGHYQKQALDRLRAALAALAALTATEDPDHAG